MEFDAVQLRLWQVARLLFVVQHVRNSRIELMSETTQGKGGIVKRLANVLFWLGVGIGGLIALIGVVALFAGNPGAGLFFLCTGAIAYGIGWTLRYILRG